MMKLILAASLASIPVMSAFMESASAQEEIARRRTNRYFETNNDQQTLISQFNLVNTARDGNLITDTDAEIDDPNQGFFTGAIQDFTSGRGEVCVNFSGTPAFQPNCPPNPTGIRFTLDSSGFPIINPDKPFVPDSSPYDADLRAELIGNTIAYSILQPGNTQPVSSYTLDLSRFPLDQNQSINNLSYIVQQDLLGKARIVIPDGRFGGNVLLQNRFVDDVPAKIFEPSATLGIFAVLSTASLLKRKTKKISAAQVRSHRTAIFSNSFNQALNYTLK